MLLTGEANSDTDYLIVGGGTAGCVLASRLSESGAAVTLIEAGIDVEGDREPAEIRDVRFRTMGDLRFFWPSLAAKITKSSVALPYSQARVLGGGSSINGMHAQRGRPADYDEWRQLGVVGWDWEGVLPFFKRLETDCDFNSDLHGNLGPIEIRRVPEKNWSGLSRAMADAMARSDYQRFQDFNDSGGDGYGAAPYNFRGRRRLSTATAYLTEEVRKRPNLRVISETEVSSLLFDGLKVVGATFKSMGQARTIRAKETIVSAGAINSPALLMRSGIGPGADLRAAGIVPLVDLPGVGANLRNHPLFILSAHLKRRARAQRHVGPAAPMLLRYSSDAQGCPATDMLLTVWERAPNPLSWDPFGRQIASFFSFVHKPFSRGSVKLSASGQLDVQFNLLEDDRDLDRMVGAVMMVDALLRDPAVAPLVNMAFAPAFTPLARAFMRNDYKAQLLSIVGALALSGPQPLRDALLRNAGVPLGTLAADAEKLRTAIKRSAIAVGHVSGTCRMGDPSERMTVLDSRCKVVGLEGLRVVDASIFPTLMAAGTNIPVIMAAEKAATMIVEDSRRS